MRPKLPGEALSIDAIPLPSFFVIGAPKCGTTSLHAYLDLHPEVSMTTDKEPFVFAYENWRTRLPLYGELFSPAAIARGESSTVYSQFPHFGDVPARIHEAVPNARLIYVVRDPLERALAHYRQRVTNGQESRTLSDALADWEANDSVYLAASRYADQIQAYLRYFDRGGLLVLDLEALSARPVATLDRIFGFIGVKTGKVEAGQLNKRLNRASDHRIPTRIGRATEGTRLRRLAAAVLPESARSRVRGLTSQDVDVQPLDPRMATLINSVLAPQAEWLREFADEPFASWSV